MTPQKRTLLIDHLDGTTRIAVTENGILREIYINREVGGSRIGQVVVGRVRNVMAGQFAFIDIGGGKNAFANIKSDVAIKNGQPLLVQVQKDATSQKGAYVSTDIALKGRLVVLHKHPPAEVGVSHKIADEKETRRLKNTVRKLLPKGYGAIVRTAAEACDSEVLSAEIEKLYNEYVKIEQRAAYVLPPTVLFPKNLTQVSSVLNDVVCDSLDEIYVSGSEEEFCTTAEYIRELESTLDTKIYYHDNADGNLLERYGVKKQVRAALEKEVLLPCGGFITIEETEACVVIDVNTGNNHHSHSYRETVLNTNRQAVTAIIDQVILRNLSGIIIIDFIGMSKQEDKAAIMSALAHEAKRDRHNPEIFGMSALGIVQMARVKRRLPLSQILQKNCPHCGGRGKVRSS